MKNPWFPLATACMAIATLCYGAEITDDFENSEMLPDSYTVRQAEGDRTASASIKDGKVRLAQSNTGDSKAKDITVHREDIPLDGPFKISGTVTTFDVETPSVLYGMAFHIQEDGSCYALRINTGNPENTLQLAHIKPGEQNRNIASWDSPVPAQTSSDYVLTIESSSPGQVKVSVSGPGLPEPLGGEVILPEPVLQGGWAGFYSSTPNRSLAFDDLSIVTEPK